MKLEQQVCSLVLAKRLKELGVKQESFCYWFTQTNAVPVVPLYGDDAERVFENWGGKTPPSSNGGLWSAFTVAELGEFVPKGEYVETFFHSLEIQLTCTFQRPIAEKDVFVGSNEADCRAKMLIYLIENDLITI